MGLHHQVESWVREALSEVGGSVDLCVEIGSKILHPHEPHNPRAIVAAATYIGLDANPGPGVDVVTLGHEFEPPGPADLVLSLQALEHDPHWRKTLVAAVQWLREGGVLCVTCAGPGCFEHEHEESPEPGYYANVSSEEILSLLRPIVTEAWAEDSTTTTFRGNLGRFEWTRSRVIAVR